MALDGAGHPRAEALRQAREQALAQLSAGFAKDELSLDEFEQRIDRAYAAQAEPELQALVADLSAPTSALLVSPRLPVLSAPEPAPERVALAVFGNVERRLSGVAPRARVLAVFGNVELDLRELGLPPGVTELEVRAVFGNVELTIPPNLAVECAGTPVLGSFASVHRVPRGEAGEPVLRIVGSAVFGNVEVRTLPSRALLAARQPAPGPSGR